MKKIYGNGVPGSVRRMETPSEQVNVSPRSLYELLMRLDKFNASDEVRKQYPWATRFVMGLPLPSWQRDFVWTDQQQSRFIESLWANLDVGTYLVNDVQGYATSPDGETVCAMFSDVVLDGQQRLTALQNYVSSQFPVPDAQGIPVYWHELSVVEQRFFSNKTFSRATVSLSDENALRRMYDLRSFGGTPHDESQRASRD